MAEEIIELPPAEIPRQITARHVIHSLGEHLAAFLAANNMQGWKQPDTYVLRQDRLADQLLLLSQATGLYIGQYKQLNKQLVKVTRASGAGIKHTVIMDMMARALGYSSYLIAYRCRTVDDFIENVWPSGAAMSLVSLDEAVEGANNRRSAVINRLLDRYRMNKERDKLTNCGGKPHKDGRDPEAIKVMRGERRKRHRLHTFDPISLRD